jgi:hypothetical protein
LQYYVPSITSGDQKGDYFVYGRDELIAKGYAVQKIRVWTGKRCARGLCVWCVRVLLFCPCRAVVLNPPAFFNQARPASNTCTATSPASSSR